MEMYACVSRDVTLAKFKVHEKTKAIREKLSA